MMCKNCGKENKKNSKKCSKCGNVFIDSNLEERIVMPQDIEDEQAKNSKRNFLYMSFTIAMAVVFILAGIFSVLTFFVADNYALVLGIISVSLFIAFIIVWIVKKTKIKNLYKIKREKKK